MISALTFSDPNFSFDELEPTKHSLKFCKTTSPATLFR